MNNISYADDMVLLRPSISALTKLFTYVKSTRWHMGIACNAFKSEFILFRAKDLRSPRRSCSVDLGGYQLKRVDRFKYLGHWVTETLSDTMDIETE